MAYEPLHHKYRPQTFAQLRGQEAIAQTLTNALQSDRIAPAYLFSGPRGTGKTSSARILAKSLNCLTSDRPTAQPCGECEVCLSITNGSALDVIEIDAASNTGVDNIREIIERAQFAPVKCRYKVYVIDECHMLSTAAFNALLKTLEEPPPRVIFVLATTDPQRVLPTIISRCQRFDFRRIPLEAIVKHLRDIADQETIEIDDEALYLVAQLSNGGMRDAQSLLDQLSLLSGTINPERVWDLVGAVSEQDLLNLLEAIATDSAETVITQCRKLLDRGREPLIVLQNLANFYLNLLIAKTSPQRQDLVAITGSSWQELCKMVNHWQLNVILQGQKKLKDSEVQIKNTTQPRLWLEITLLSLLPSANQTTVITQTIKTLANQPQSTQPVSKQKTNSNINTNLSSPPPESQSIDKPKTPTTQPSSPPVSTNFTNLEELKELVCKHCEKNLIRAFFRQNCHIIQFDSKTAQVVVRTQGLWETAKNSQAEIESAFSQIAQQPVTVFFQVDSSVNPANSPSPSSTPETSSTNNYTKFNQKPNSTPNSVPTQPHQKSISSPPPIKDQKTVKSSTSTPRKKDNSAITAESNTTESQPESHFHKVTKNAAENLAKSFKGEIVLTEIKPVVKLAKIINRPKIEDFNDGDEMPF